MKHQVIYGQLLSDLQDEIDARVVQMRTLKSRLFRIRKYYEESYVREAKIAEIREEIEKVGFRILYLQTRLSEFKNHSYAIAAGALVGPPEIALLMAELKTNKAYQDVAREFHLEFGEKVPLPEIEWYQHLHGYIFIPIPEPDNIDSMDDEAQSKQWEEWELARRDFANFDAESIDWEQYHSDSKKEEERERRVQDKSYLNDDDIPF